MRSAKKWMIAVAIIWSGLAAVWAWRYLWPSAVQLNDRGVQLAVEGANSNNPELVDRAIALFDQSIAKSPTRLAYCNRAVSRQDKGDWEGAVADYTRAIELSPRDLGLYCLRGSVRERKGDLEGAAADFTRVLVADPACFTRIPTPYHRNYMFPASAYVLRGLVRLRQGKVAEAEADFAKHLELQPEDRQHLAIERRTLAK